ncbi:excinuclease ABC subunit UvrC [Desulforamulus hydrothermalis]|uniref:UvrABC system protein C n=1 Tax=Desulforamulus hydrothermalis Lam5 = DSM 18033 TaxID=1121428 RepID=K8EFV7_9FIRM|nr:excinuclease ABC subunit UvrC [Desulforamulus hydrothermalis]CCO07576.1 UvrABC system protein C [Desulforamulus hydrothermalis Lam5 = DSM 18033]SHH20751.1 Excinuclease ABC subunit C [Desulforamulus hydrothermalis Lam5 = DSM 18033]
MALADKIKNIPARPGVYLYKDEAGQVIYVGKAVSLKNRVRSYFQAGARQSPKVQAMLRRAADLEYIVTDSEMEALILENNLIKEHRPKYNVLLKDDKTYPYIKVTLQEEFPRVQVTRRVLKDGARYFGPFTSAGAVHETLRLLKKIFPLRSCQQRQPAGRQRPCLNYHIKRCLGPCCNLVDRAAYRETVKEVVLFLEGRQEDLIKRLRRRMEEAADHLEFEKAAELRDQLQAVEKIVERQKVVATDPVDQDVIAMARGFDEACLTVFFIRGGKLIGRENYFLEGTDARERGEVMAAFVQQFYNQTEFVPGEILLSEEIAGADLVAAWLSELRGGKVYLKVPQRGDKHKLVAMAAQNALLALEQARLERQADRQAVADALGELAAALGLPQPPRRLECYDISNIQGAETVASMVVFEEGKPARRQYRRFKIRTVEGPNDFAAMQEVISRRLARYREEQQQLAAGTLAVHQAKFSSLPDLIIIDGGKGQLAAARQAMAAQGFAHIPAFGLAKEEELLFAPDRPEAIRLPRESRALQLLQRLRDEAHRFAVTYHRQLRSKRNLKSILDEIEGIGPVRRRELYKAFASLEAIKQATLEELARVPGMNKKAAEAVYLFLREQE